MCRRALRRRAADSPRRASTVTYGYVPLGRRHTSLFACAQRGKHVIRTYPMVHMQNVRVKFRHIYAIFRCIKFVYERSNSRYKCISCFFIMKL